MFLNDRCVDMCVRALYVCLWMCVNALNFVALRFKTHTKSQITTRKNICTNRTCFFFFFLSLCLFLFTSLLPIDNIRVVFSTSRPSKRRKNKTYINRKQRQINSSHEPKITTNKQHEQRRLRMTRRNCTNNKNKMFIIC